MNIVSYIVDSGTSAIFNKAIEEAKLWRTQIFFSQFIAEFEKGLLSESNDSDINQKLKKFLNESEANEVFAETYRRVCLSASRRIGPKMLAYIVAPAVLENRLLTELEDIFSLIAQDMSDSELSQYCTFFEEKLDTSRKNGRAYYLLDKQSVLKRAHAQISISAPCTAEKLGVWASKLERYGVISIETSFLKGNEESEEESRYTYVIWLNEKQQALYNLIRRSQGPT